MRAADEVRRGRTGGQGDLFPFLRTYFQTIAMATVAKSALEAQGARLPARVRRRRACTPHELLHVALGQARALADAGYRPPLPRTAIPVAGRTGIATLEMLLVNLRDGGFISRVRLRHRAARSRA